MSRINFITKLFIMISNARKTIVYNVLNYLKIQCF
jgi:hypothetical protein